MAAYLIIHPVGNNSSYYRSMSAGHAARMGHEMKAVTYRVHNADGEDSMSMSTLVRECCGEIVPAVTAMGLTRAPVDADVPNAVALAQREIIADMASGRVPTMVSNFSELHDYVDANEYGGLCNAEMGIDWIMYMEDDDHGNRVQDALNRWITSGAALAAFNTQEIAA